MHFSSSLFFLQSPKWEKWSRCVLRHVGEDTWNILEEDMVDYPPASRLTVQDHRRLLSGLSCSLEPWVKRRAVLSRMRIDRLGCAFSSRIQALKPYPCSSNTGSLLNILEKGGSHPFLSHDLIFELFSSDSAQAFPGLLYTAHSFPSCSRAPQALGLHTCLLHTGLTDDKSLIVFHLTWWLTWKL